MGKCATFFACVNCPRVKNKLFHFMIDNIFFGSTYWLARYSIVVGTHLGTMRSNMLVIFRQKMPIVTSSRKIPRMHFLLFKIFSLIYRVSCYFG